MVRKLVKRGPSRRSPIGWAHYSYAMRAGQEFAEAGVLIKRFRRLRPTLKSKVNVIPGLRFAPLAHHGLNSAAAPRLVDANILVDFVLGWRINIGRNPTNRRTGARIALCSTCLVRRRGKA